MSNARKQQRLDKIRDALRRQMVGPPVPVVVERTSDGMKYFCGGKPLRPDELRPHHHLLEIIEEPLPPEVIERLHEWALIENAERDAARLKTESDKKDDATSG
jgi:hypothetical protein